MSEAKSALGRVVKVLKENENAFVSGAALAEGLHISRTGIWKHVQALKAQGYLIESHPKQGYKLTGAPDSLAHEEIEPNLKTAWLGRPYHYLRRVSSTNDHLLLLAAQGAPHGTVVSAGEQTRGRGRLRREWLSLPNRGIYVSILLRNPIPVQLAPQSTCIAALALVRVLRESYGLPAFIKWPNDVLIGHKKVAGVLTETQSDQDYTRFIVIGAGVNVNHTAEELAEPFRYPATSVAAEASGPVRRQELFLRFLEQFESICDAFLNGGFSVLLPEVERYSGILGKAVTVVCSDREIFGRAESFTAEGALVLLREDGSRETIWVGDVTRVEGVV